ncbi:hypothetical protein BC830DRAFT_71739 [Chytriomyces sp. MP71]|nr:hypothetical protein BC830DRAFT_71739 [Chytriomyces sp. MP71]
MYHLLVHEMTESVARSVFNNTDEDSSVVSGKRRRATVEGSVMGCRVESAVVGTEEVPAAGTAKANSKRSRVHSASEDKAETLKPRASTRTRRSLPNSSIPKAKNSPEKMAEETTVEVSGPSTRPRWTAAPFLPTLNLSLFETPLPHPVSCTSSAKEGASLSKKKQINIIRDFFHVSAVHPPRVAIILSLSEKSQNPDLVSLGVIMGFERSGLMMELAMRQLIASGDDGDGAQKPLDENELSRLCFDGVVSGNGSENACPLKMVKENESNLDDISAEDEAEHLSRLQASAIQALHNVLSKPNPTLPPFDQTTMVPASKRRVSNQPITSNYSIPHIRGIHLPSLLVSRNPHVCTAVHVDENTDPDDSEWSRSLAFLVPSTAAAASAFTNNATPHWKSLCKYLHSTNAPVSSLSTKKRAPSKTALPSVFVVPKRQPRKAPLVRRFPSARPRSLSPSGTPSSPITWSPSPPPPPRVYKRGERAREAEEVWERHAGMRALYARKEFLRAGMYSGDLNRDVVVTVAEEDADTVAEPEDTLISEMTSRPFKFSMPMYYGETILETEEDFELPFDLHRFVKVVGSGELAPPPQLWALEGKRKPPQYVRIKKNIFVDRRPRKPALETPVCFCVVPADGGPACGADCLNRLMQFECTPGKCPAGDACSNQMFQRGVQTEDLEVCLTNGRGFGIRTNAAISKNRLVMEYCGEIISQETCLERMDTLYAGTQHYYFLNYDRGEVIDGGRKGSLARFVNHSCDPNCRIEKWSVNGEYHVGLFADKEIPPSSELTYDYKFEAFGPMRKCLCGGRKCRGFLGRNGRGGDGLSDIKALKLGELVLVLPVGKEGEMAADKGLSSFV